MKRTEKKEEIRDLLYTCAVMSQGDAWKWEKEAGTDGADPAPMDEMADCRSLLRCLDYLEETYGDRIEPGCTGGEAYYIQIEPLCTGHPIFTLGTFYVLLLAGARLFVECCSDWDDPDVFRTRRFVQQLAAAVPGVTDLTDDLSFSPEGAWGFLRQHPDIRRMVFLGDCANAYPKYNRADKLGLSIHHPGAHILVADYEDEGTCRADAHLRAFGRQCMTDRIDYEAYHAMRNQVDWIDAGFDFGDLFWGFEETVAAWSLYQVPRDRKTVIYFTDKSRDGILLPVDTETCCRVVFGDELDCRYPQYDFLQLL